MSTRRFVKYTFLKLDPANPQMKEIMVQAGTAVTGGLPIGVEVKTVVRWPQSLGDCRAEKDQRMWVEVRGLMNGGLLDQVGA